ncbi:hypothetical protein [Paenibacillus wulumuqiensis]|uniref:hypothetical protein n=1 Tax=Paenibacillus wulumuqiensis TaxID=1567107 RepID=UPI000A59A4EB|nr:hypothetical protein [Paenibacillus wulumuqiensis]
MINEGEEFGKKLSFYLIMIIFFQKKKESDRGLPRVEEATVAWELLWAVRLQVWYF